MVRTNVGSSSPPLPHPTAAHAPSYNQTKHLGNSKKTVFVLIVVIRTAMPARRTFCFLPDQALPGHAPNVIHQVTLVEQQQQVLVACILAYVLLQELAASALWIARIQHLLGKQQQQQQQ
jgi:hypothetical protein